MDTCRESDRFSDRIKYSQVFQPFFPQQFIRRSTLTIPSRSISRPIVRVVPASVDLEPSGISADWILSGTPTAWNKEVARSYDRISQIVVWECSEGLFKWHYTKDESTIVISGEAFLIDNNGEEVRFGPGDVGFFPAGTICTWRVPGPFRKVAVIREPMWRPLGFAVKAWNRLLGMTGLSGKPSLILADRKTRNEPPRKVA
jgi:uncharacterized protein